MANDTTLQLNQNTITNCLIIPVNANPVNGEMHVDSSINR